MLTTAIEPGAQYTREFARIASGRNGSPWLFPLREAALARFTERGLPTPRDEDWRFTNVAPIAGTVFNSPETFSSRVHAHQLRSYLWTGVEQATLVFVNGRFAPELSATGALAGVQVLSLATALNHEHPVLHPHLGRHAASQHSAFTALNTALFADGALIYLPRGVVLEVPIHLLYVSVTGEQPHAAHPRNLVVAEEDSQFKLVESYAGLNEGVYFNNAVTELIAGPNCVAQYCRIVRESDAAYHVAHVHLHQERSSSVQVHTVQLGGALLRSDFQPVLAGDGADCVVHGLYLLRGTQHADNHVRVEHRSPHGTSRQFFRGILDDSSRGVFSGRIIVHPGAQKTDAKQTNMNLLLGDNAQINSNPQLEIFADDVKCTHGSTTGQVDDEAIFYLRSRGMSEAAARSLLVFAFAKASLDHIPIEPLRVQLEHLVLERLPHPEPLREAV